MSEHDGPRAEARALIERVRYGRRYMHPEVSEDRADLLAALVAALTELERKDEALTDICNDSSISEWVLRRASKALEPKP